MNQTRSRCELVKYVYAYMLQNLTDSEIIRFWAKHPLNSQTVLQTLDSFWKNQATLTAKYIASVMDSFALLVRSQNEGKFEEVIENIFREYRNGIPLDSEDILELCAPFCEKLYVSEDVYLELYRGFALIAVQSLFPGSNCEFIEAHLSLSEPSLTLKVDAGFKVSENMITLIKTLLKQMPLPFGLQAAHQVENVPPLDPEKGVCFRLYYPAGNMSKRIILSGLLEHSEKELSLWKILEQKHLALMSRTEVKITFKDNRIFRNDTLVARDSTAHILKRIMRGCCLENRDEFENREFLRDSFIAPDTANPNLVVRLNRAFNAAREKIPEIRIEKIGRGLFKVEKLAQFDYCEE